MRSTVKLPSRKYNTPAVSFREFRFFSCFKDREAAVWRFFVPLWWNVEDCRHHAVWSGRGAPVEEPAAAHRAERGHGAHLAVAVPAGH